MTNSRTGKSVGHHETVEMLAWQGLLNTESYYQLPHDGRSFEVDGTDLREIDIYFKKTDGTEVDVTNFSMNVDLFNDVSQL